MTIDHALLNEIFAINSQAELEPLVKRAKQLTSQYFGKTISLYAPLYISNYCDNVCVYCGFNCQQKLNRIKLSAEEIERECASLAAGGIQNILILTGESRKHTPLSYLVEAVKLATKYFPNVALEVYPVDEEEYKQLKEAGADGVTVYQETYNLGRYSQLHLAGKKMDFRYRFEAPQRIANAGMHYISIGVLLGLAPWQDDIRALFTHLDFLESNYPGVEFSLSFPRMQLLTQAEVDYVKVSDLDLVKIIVAARLLFPRVGLNLSTRESATLRDNLIGIGITKMSAGSLTTVGGYSAETASGEQFAINDHRTWQQVKSVIKQKGYDPVVTDWRRFG